MVLVAQAGRGTGLGRDFFGFTEGLEIGDQRDDLLVGRNGGAVGAETFGDEIGLFVHADVDLLGCPVLLAYFLAGERALQETLRLAQAEPPILAVTIRDHAAAELCLAVRSVARQEVDAFCSVCRHHPETGNSSAAKANSG